MSLDALADELRRFEEALAAFTEVVRTTEAGRLAAEDRAHGLWDDAFRQEFARRHAEYAEAVEAFLQRDAERYADFIALKRHQVERYLSGH